MAISPISGELPFMQEYVDAGPVYSLSEELPWVLVGDFSGALFFI